MIDALGVKCARPPDNPVNLIPFRQQQFRKIRSVLSGDPRNQSSFQKVFALFIISILFDRHRSFDKLVFAAALVHRGIAIHDSSSYCLRFSSRFHETFFTGRENRRL